MKYELKKLEKGSTVDVFLDSGARLGCLTVLEVTRSGVLVAESGSIGRMRIDIKRVVSFNDCIRGDCDE